MKNLSTSAGLSKAYTNHSLRATCVTILDKAGFASRDIMAVSGHKSESSLKHYVKTSDEKKKHMSAALAKQMKQEKAQPSPRPEDIPSTSNAIGHVGREVVQQQATTINLNEQQQKSLVDGGSTLLSNSQEQVIFQELTSTLNVSNSPTISGSTIQNFHFHGSVMFYNNSN